MTTVRKSLGFAFLERYLVLGLQLLSFTILARLLTPQQIGLYSVSLALISVAQVLRDFGLSNYLIQRKNLDAEDIRTALGMSMILGGTFFVLVNAVAPLVGDFYKDSSLTEIVRIISLNFLILPFNSILIALFRRDMKFDVLMRVNVCAAIVSTATTLGLAWAGWGSWSLAWGEISSNLVICVGAMMAGGTHHLKRPTLTRWRNILSFGGPVTLANVVTSISMDINDLVVGKILNFAQVAIISRAQGLMNLFNRDLMGTIRAVAYPGFARLCREDSMLEQQYVSSLTAVTAIAWPFYGFLALFPLEVLRLVFGPQWDQSAPLVPLFCLAGAFSATINLIPTLMLAAGHSRLVALADLIFQPVKAIALTLIVYHYRELRPFVIGFLILAIIGVPYFYAFKQRCLPTDFGAVARCLSKNFCIAFLSLAPAFAATYSFRRPGETMAYPMFFACAAATVFIWSLCLWAFKHPLRLEFQLILKSKFPSKLPIQY